MANQYRALARRHLDEQLAPWRAHRDAPPDGWIRTIREALGMSITDLARQLDVTPAAVRKYEEAEHAGTIQLATMARVAAAMGASVQYAIVPRAPLEQLVRERAEHVARRELAATNHTMELEQQRPPTDQDAELIEARVRDLVDSRGLWRER